MMDLLSEKRNQLLLALFALFLVGIVIYSAYAGLIILFAFFLFGMFSTIWKNKTARFLSLALLIVLALANVAINGVKFGIDFSGGTRIPVVLEHPVDQTTMNDMVQIIKSRASVLGLTEVSVRAVGTSQIDVEVPGTNENLIKNIED
ncbi:MAG: hypothetical protein PHS02_03360, partial [Candidatus ainarchaeum sp.]|nr:hypothetical protein [Candidatus ainarchaeum sp.]